MKKILFLLTVCCVTLHACNDDDPLPSFKDEGFTFENYPKVDGSTSTAPLQNIIACRLLGINYKWEELMHAYFIWQVTPDYEAMPDGFWENHIKVSQTHQSFLNLIDGEADVILSARKMSPDEKQYADRTGVTLIETPVALDALVFIANPQNPVYSLKEEEIQNIYAGEIINWKELGGNNSTIKPFIRNANSGSQELMESLVMKDKKISDWSESLELHSMMLAFTEVLAEPAGLCYTVQYYKENIVRNKDIKTLAVNNVYPDKKTIRSRTYPYTSEIYVIIRANQDKSSSAYKLYELLQTKDGKSLIEESGYIACP